MISPQAFTEKFTRRIKAASQDMIDGVNGVSISPAVQAAGKQAKMLANLTAAVTSGKWGNALRKVTVEEWRSKMISKGVPRVSAGVDAAQAKILDFASQLLPAVQAAVGKISTMPDITLDDNINRATSFMREMSKFQKK